MGVAQVVEGEVGTARVPVAGKEAAEILEVGIPDAESLEEETHELGTAAGIVTPAVKVAEAEAAV